MSEEVAIIKRGGARPTELFQKDKLHSSIQAACLSVRSHEGEAAQTAENVCQAVLQWLSQKAEVTSEDIRRMAAYYLDLFHPEAAYLYKHHSFIL